MKESVPALRKDCMLRVTLILSHRKLQPHFVEVFARKSDLHSD